MSQPPTRSDDSINANVVAFVIMTFFVLISILLISQLPNNSASSRVALAAATVEVQPSATPLPSTLTPTPPPPTQTPTVMPSATPTEPPPATATDAPGVADTNAAPADTASAAAEYDPDLIAHGQQQFLLCAACHGPDGHGIPNLGKDLVASEFVHSQTDEELLAFVKMGRPIWDPLNTTGIDMPPKGGNPAMTDDDILAVIAYLRSLSGEAAADTVQSSTPDVAAADYEPALIAYGQQQFMLCAACHGPDARGIPNLGKDLVASEFVHSQTDEELLTFIKTGRPIWDPLNTTGIDMPPKGGNPAMTDDDILAVIAYMRSLSESGG